MASIIDAIIRLRDQFTPTLSRVREQLTETQRVSMRAARDVTRLGNTISGIGESMMIPAAAIGATMAKASQTYMGFEKTMTQAKIRSQATTEEFTQMMDAAIDYAGTYPASGEEVARVFDMLAAAGFKAGQQIGTVPAILEGAIAAGGDIEGMADVIIKTMSSFKMQGETVEETKQNATRIADIMQMTVNNARMNMADLSTTLGYLGAPAAAAGASLSELGAAMAIASNAGLEASTVGTSLRAIFLRLAREPRMTAAALQELGISAKDEVGDFRSLMEVIDELRPKMKEMGTGEQMELAAKIAGTEASSAFLALINASEEEFHKLQQAIENSEGASKKAFEEMSNSMWGAMKAMESAVEELFNILGQALKPTIVDAMNSIRDFALSVKNFAKENPETVSLLIKLAGGFIALTAGMLVAGKAITLIGAFAKFLVPIGGALGTGATLTSLFAARLANLVTSLQVIGRVGLLVFSSIGKSILSAFGFLLKFPFSVVLSIGKSVMGVVNIFRTLGLVNGLITLITGSLMKLAAFFLTNPIGLAILAIGLIVMVVATHWETFKSVAEVVWNKISYVITQVVNTLQAVFGTLAARAQVHFEKLVELWNKVTGQSQTSGGIISGVINTLGSTFVAAFTIIGGVVELTFANLGSIIEMFMGVAEGLITFLTGVFTGNWSMAWEGIKGIVSSVVKGIVEMVENMAAAISDAVARIRGEEGTAMRDLEITRRQAAVSEQLAQGGAEGMRAIREGNALGTDFWTGGLSWVHEQGPELIDLPNGTRVIPHSSSLREEYERGAADVIDAATGGYNAGGFNTPTVLEQAIRTAQPDNLRAAERTGNPSSNIKPRTEMPKPSPNITVTIPKLADQIFVREKADIENIVNQLTYRFQAYAMNRVVHAVR